MTTLRNLPPLKGVLLDYGGVLAEEGFRGGLYAIARKNGLDPEPFFLRASDAIYETGYIAGKATEADYWDALRRATGIRGTDEELTGGDPSPVHPSARNENGPERDESGRWANWLEIWLENSDKTKMG